MTSHRFAPALAFSGEGPSWGNGRAFSSTHDGLAHADASLGDFIIAYGNLLCAISSGVALCASVEISQAACILNPASGDDVSVCSSGVSPSLTDLLGNNALIFPAFVTGVVAGNVTFGAGADTVQMNSGNIRGTLDQGAGNDRLVITAGRSTALSGREMASAHVCKEATNSTRER
jgi:Ca2+-binding RTX toxin-like protein